MYQYVYRYTQNEVHVLLHTHKRRRVRGELPVFPVSRHQVEAHPVITVRNSLNMIYKTCYGNLLISAEMFDVEMNITTCLARSSRSTIRPSDCLRLASPFIMILRPTQQVSRTIGCGHGLTRRLA